MPISSLPQPLPSKQSEGLSWSKTPAWVWGMVLGQPWLPLRGAGTPWEPAWAQPPWRRIGQEHTAGAWGRLDPANFRWMGGARTCLMQGAGAGAGETDPGGWGPQIYPIADSGFWGSVMGKRWAWNYRFRNRGLIPSRKQRAARKENQRNIHYVPSPGPRRALGVSLALTYPAALGR